MKTLIPMDTYGVFADTHYTARAYGKLGIKVADLKIDPEFRDKIPPLTEAEFKQLEENIISDGEIREPIITWNGVIIDGHHRWRIHLEHPEIPYKTKEIHFENRYAAIIWICKEQLGRRNLSDVQQTALIGQRYKAEKMAQGGDRKSDDFSNGQNVHLNKEESRREQQDGTAGRIGKEYGLSSRQVRRSERFVDGLTAADKVAPGFKEKILTGEVKAPKSIIAEIANMPDKEKEKAVQAIQNGERVQPKEKAPIPRTRLSPRYHCRLFSLFIAK